ncbi:hypothetical protein Cgig2_012862 [Carnegiea gigantea]|uniref:Ion transport domain-containing protein n=1 Tax=Carnegiea gigantea TaxID=171969 RepID=A0A9Q1JY81_9CARY|nr:hypothetical protein Cgig2_012862 [Carnegiea gigantea]
MDDERDEIPMLSDSHPQLFDELEDSALDKFSWTRSVSDSGASFQENGNVGHTGPLRSERRMALVQMSGPLYIKSKPEKPYDPNPDVRGQQGNVQLTDTYSTYDGVAKHGGVHNVLAEKNERLLKSGPLGMCNDPYCTTCPSYYHYKAPQGRFRRTSDIFDTKFHNALYGDAKGWAKSFWSFLQSYMPGVMNPHAKDVQRWNKFFVISCLVAIFVDPLFFFVLSVLEDSMCIVMDEATATTMFRLAYVSPESRVVGAGDLVDHPIKIALHYFTGFFLIDLFAVLPIPQVLILVILPRALGTSGANYAKNLIRAAILVQYLPRLYRFLPLLAGQSPIGFIFESAWANFVINLLTFVLSGHVVGSGWYLFGLQRVNQCLRDACHNSQIHSCMEFIDCGHGDGQRHNSSPGWSDWISNKNATACFDIDKGGFDYGIYGKAVNLVTQGSFTTRYVYSLFWGFQQISTLAGNLVPSYFVWEVLFTMAIIGLGLLLFALLIGNMQNFLQSLGRRRLEMSLRRRDVEQWMRHRRLPEELRSKVREAERYTWAATRGVNEEMLMENLPEDLQREIRRHLFRFVKKVGKLESVGEDGIVVPLSEGDVCGEELLMWFLEHSSEYRDGKKSRATGHRLVSNRAVRCLTNVEAFALRASDIEEVTSLFSRFLRNPRVQGAIRYESPYWRCFAATRIQVAWRYRKKRLTRKETVDRR